MRRKTPASFRRDADLLLALLQDLRDEALAAAIAVDVGRVDEVDAVIQGSMHHAHRVVVCDTAPTASDLPGAEADFGNLESSLAEVTIVHRASLTAAE